MKPAKSPRRRGVQRATSPSRRRADAKLLVVHPDGRLSHASRVDLVRYLHAGDLLIANDAATLPASLHGTHERSGAEIEVRLVGRGALAPQEVEEFQAIAFGAGDHRTRTEDRAPPPALRAGDVLRLGPLRATVGRLLGHPRLFDLRLAGTADEIWDGLSRHGKPIQYAHVSEALRLGEVWTRVAAVPVAFEPPSAGFALDWSLLAELRARGIDFAALTLAAGVSSTGDPELDARLPLDEAYHLPASTVASIARARARGCRVVAIGTTVTRALEDAASKADRPGPRLRLEPGTGIATRRLGPDTALLLVDAIVTGVHAPGDAHYQLLRAFADDEVLNRMSAALQEAGYRSHEFGDSVLLLRGRSRIQHRRPADRTERPASPPGPLRAPSLPPRPYPAERASMARKRSITSLGPKSSSSNSWRTSISASLPSPTGLGKRFAHSSASARDFTSIRV